MKNSRLLIVFFALLGALLIGCGALHPTLTSITVAPANATAPSSPQTSVGFTATGNFTNHKSRTLSVADGLSWSSSNITVVSINSLGSATCKMPGTVTITAQAPANLQFTIGTGINNTSAKVSGTAMLTCT